MDGFYRCVLRQLIDLIRVCYDKIYFLEIPPDCFFLLTFSLLLFCLQGRNIVIYLVNEWLRSRGETILIKISLSVSCVFAHKTTIFQAMLLCVIMFRTTKRALLKNIEKHVKNAGSIIMTGCPHDWKNWKTIYFLTLQTGKKKKKNGPMVQIMYISFLIFRFSLFAEL